MDHLTFYTLFKCFKLIALISVTICSSISKINTNCYNKKNVLKEYWATYFWLFTPSFTLFELIALISVTICSLLFQKDLHENGFRQSIICDIMKRYESCLPKNHKHTKKSKLLLIEKHVHIVRNGWWNWCKNATAMVRTNATIKCNFLLTRQQSQYFLSFLPRSISSA